jgi:hypothetical protein
VYRSANPGRRRWMLRGRQSHRASERQWRGCQRGGGVHLHQRAPPRPQVWRGRESIWWRGRHRRASGGEEAWTGDGPAKRAGVAAEVAGRQDRGRGKWIRAAGRGRRSSAVANHHSYPAYLGCVSICGFRSTAAPPTPSPLITANVRERVDPCVSNVDARPLLLQQTSTPTLAARCSSRPARLPPTRDFRGEKAASIAMEGETKGE